MFLSNSKDINGNIKYFCTFFCKHEGLKHVYYNMSVHY